MSIADIAVVAIIVLAGLIAFSLGFVRVVLALAGWVGAAFATLYGFPYLKPFARDWISIGFVADAAAGAAIFILSLIVLTIISHSIGRLIRSSGLSALDRSVGLVFGLFLGGVVVSLAYLGLAWAVDLPNEQPEWYRSARTRRNDALPTEGVVIGLAAPTLQSQLDDNDNDNDAADADADADEGVAVHADSGAAEQDSAAIPTPDD